MKEDHKAYSRREFLKVAGIAGATVGVGTGLGGLMAACGGEEATSTTAAEATTTSQSAVTSAGGTVTTTATTISTAAEEGRPLRIGMVEPQTGTLAGHAIGVDWALKRFARALPDGIVCADGKKRVIEILNRDTQSDSNRAAQVTGDLITNDTVDIVVSGGAPDTYLPSAGVCETLGCPSLSDAGPWQAFWYQRNPPAEGFKWTWGNLLGTEQSIHCFMEMWDQIPNNKVVGMLLKNDAEGASWSGENSATGLLKANGYKIVEPSMYPVGAEDFTEQISIFKKEGCDIICGASNPPDFTNFWTQAYQQGFRPKLVSSGNALLFPQTLDAIGDIGVGLLGEVGWHRSFPFKDSLTGDDANAMADDFEATMGMQYSSGSAGPYVLIEWAVDVLKRAKNPEDKESVVEAIGTTNMESTFGPIDFTSPVDKDPMAPDSHHPVKNCRKMPFAGSQWVKATDGEWEFKNEVCSVKTAPGCEVTAQVLPLSYS